MESKSAIDAGGFKRAALAARRNRLKLAVGLLVAAVGFLGGCAVMSPQIMSEADPALPFQMLTDKADDFEGRMVIVGGYVLEVRNRGQETVLVVLQAPLGGGQEPVSADRSEGRFMVQHDRFLDPEVFTKGRKITVGGVVRGVTTEDIGDEPYGYLTLESREIFLWEQELYPTGAIPRYDQPYRYYDPRHGGPYYPRY